MYFLFSVFGFLFGFRIIDVLETFVFKKNSTRKSLNRLGIVLLFLLSVMYVQKTTYAIISFAVAYSVLIVEYYFLANQMKNKFEQQIIYLFDMMILKLQLGYSFRISFREAVSLLPQEDQFFFQKVLDSLYCEQPIKNFATLHFWDFQAEIMRLDRLKANIFDQVKTARRHRQILLDLKKRSSQIRQQVYFQASVLAVLYFCLLAFVLFQFGLKSNMSIVLGSIGLYIMGVMGVIYLGLKRKWKV